MCSKYGEGWGLWRVCVHALDIGDKVYQLAMAPRGNAHALLAVASAGAEVALAPVPAMSHVFAPLLCIEPQKETSMAQIKSRIRITMMGNHWRLLRRNNFYWTKSLQNCPNVANFPTNL